MKRILDIFALHQQSTVRIFIKGNPFRYTAMSKTCKFLDEANRYMPIVVFLFYRIKLKFPKGTNHCFHFSFHAEPRIPLNVEQGFL